MIVMAGIVQAMVRVTDLETRVILMPFDYLGFFLLKVLILVIIIRFSPDFTINSEVKGNVVHMTGINSAGHEAFIYLIA